MEEWEDYSIDLKITYLNLSHPLQISCINYLFLSLIKQNFVRLKP